MKLKIVILSLLVLFPAVKGILAQGQTVSIFDIQYTTTPDGQSPKHGQVVSCMGGIVTHKVVLGRPRIIIQDPIIHDPDIQGTNVCWSAIQIKDWFYTTFNDVNVGDWIELNDVTVEDYRGTTFLQYWNSNPDGSIPSFTVISTDNPVPQPVVVDINEITSPLLQDPELDHIFYLESHNAEKYESMWLKVKNIYVTRKDLGKAKDNYILQSSIAPDDPNFSCWASDYMNVDAAGMYHPYVSIDRQFCSIEGILEQYTNIPDGLGDYYQLLTTKTPDFLVTQPGDCDGDCDVDSFDFSHLSQFWRIDCGADPNMCGQADLTGDSVVDLADLDVFAYHWLNGVNMK